MALRVDVGVDAKRDARDVAPSRARDRLDAVELAGRLRVDRLQAERHGALELVGATCRRR